MSTSSQVTGTVVAVCRNAEPGLPKPVVDEIQICANWGIAGDYHAGHTVRHRYLARKDPQQPNLRQVLLVDMQSYRDLSKMNMHIGPGMMGENITVQGLNIASLLIGTQLCIGEVVLEIIEVRIPCNQLNGIHEGLLQAVTTKEQHKKSYKAGSMARVLRGGNVRAGDNVTVADLKTPLLTTSSAAPSTTHDADAQ